ISYRRPPCSITDSAAVWIAKASRVSGLARLAIASGQETSMGWPMPSAAGFSAPIPRPPWQLTSVPSLCRSSIRSGSASSRSVADMGQPRESCTTHTAPLDPRRAQRDRRSRAAGRLHRQPAVYRHTVDNQLDSGGRHDDVSDDDGLAGPLWPGTLGGTGEREARVDVEIFRVDAGCDDDLIAGDRGADGGLDRRIHRLKTAVAVQQPYGLAQLAAAGPRVLHQL